METSAADPDARAWALRRALDAVANDNVTESTDAKQLAEKSSLEAQSLVRPELSLGLPVEVQDFCVIS